MTDDPGEENTGTTTDTGTDEKDPAGTEALGDPGKKALDSMKARLRTAREAAAAAAAEVERLKASAADPEEIARQVRAEIAQEQAAERVLDKIETKAGKLFEDPDVARALLASRASEFVKDGKIDEAAITKALEKMIEDKPYLAARAGKRFTGSADGGARNAAPDTSDMNLLIRRQAGHSV